MSTLKAKHIGNLSDGPADKEKSSVQRSSREGEETSLNEREEREEGDPTTG